MFPRVLLIRTPRMAAPSEACRVVGPRNEEIEAALSEVRKSWRARPDHGGRERGLRGPLACPGEILPGYLEIVIGNGLTDIVAERFDAGVAPSYFASR